MTKSCNIKTNKEADRRRRFYRTLCDSPQGADIPLFAQAWWLDTACPEAWTVLTVPDTPDWTAVDAGHAASMAAMPIHTPYGDTVRNALFTQHTAIWLSPDNQTKEHKILTDLATALSRYRYVYLQFPTPQRQALPFYWRNLDLRLRYSYHLENLRAWRGTGGTEAVETALRAGMGRDSRRRLHLAETYGITVKPCSASDFCRLYRQTFAARGRRIADTETVCLTQLIEAACQRRQGLLWGGYTPDGELLSAAFVAWQGDTAYYVAGGSLRRKPPHAHAQTLVLFKAIAHCAGFCDIFDFEGSMVEGIAQFFQGFGAAPHPYITLNGRRPGLCKRAWRKLGRLIPCRKTGRPLKP